MRDRDVRMALHHKVLMDHHGDSNTLVLDELGLRHGVCRVDIAVVNSYLHGYEIKSDADTLERLPSQISVYSDVLDRATLVVGKKHIKKAKAIIPEWWGIKVVSVGPRGGIIFETHRPLSMNPKIDPVALAELLWRPEAVRILQKLGAPTAILRKPRSSLYQYLAEVLKLDELRDLIRQCLKVREKWRGHLPLSSGDDLSTPIPR
ncbi:MAG: sce7726 family protein [Proteobacteria bacterium]|nr:sce7726 family protein [Pseudomonadota bacterium]